MRLTRIGLIWLGFGLVGCGPFTGSPAGECSSNWDCASDEFCSKLDGDCAGVGLCEASPDACLALYEPVCGCDGVTYSNRCNAAAAGVNVDHVGVCRPADPGLLCGGIAGIPCPGAAACVDDPTDDCDPASGGADCGGVCVCEEAGECADGSQWDSSPQVCACVLVDDPCQRLLCPVGTHCVVNGDGAVCEAD